jgi:hypothetical protein
MAGILDGAVQSLIAARQMKQQAAMQAANMAYRNYMGQIAMERLNDTEQYHQGVLANDQNKNQLFSDRTRSQLAGQTERANATVSSANLRHQDALAAADIHKAGMQDSALTAIGNAAYRSGAPLVTAFGPLAQANGISMKGVPNVPSPLVTSKLELDKAQMHHLQATDAYHNAVLNISAIRNQQQFELGKARVNLEASKVSSMMQKYAFDEQHTMAQVEALKWQTAVAKAKMAGTLGNQVGKTIGVMKGLSSVMSEAQAKIASITTARFAAQQKAALYQSFLDKMNSDGSDSMITDGANPIRITRAQAQGVVDSANESINGSPDSPGGYNGSLKQLQSIYDMDNNLYQQYSKVVSGTGETPANHAVLRTSSGHVVAQPHRILAPARRALPVHPPVHPPVHAKATAKHSDGYTINGTPDQQKKAHDILRSLGG